MTEKPTTQALIEFLSQQELLQRSLAEEFPKDLRASSYAAKAANFRAAADALRSLPAAQELIQHDAEFQEWAQGYLNAARWAGHDRSDAIRTELLERDAEVRSLKAEVEGLKATMHGLPPTLAAGMISRLGERAERAEAEVARLTQEGQ